MVINADLKKLLSAAFDNFQDWIKKEVTQEEYERLKFDFAFHMTDWKDDLAKLSDIYAHPENWSEKEASDAIAAFLIHAPWHVQHARKLLLAEEVEDLEAENLEAERTRQ